MPHPSVSLEYQRALRCAVWWPLPALFMLVDLSRCNFVATACAATAGGYYCTAMRKESIAGAARRDTAAVTLDVQQLSLDGKTTAGTQFLTFKTLNIWPPNTAKARCDLVRATVIGLSRDTQGEAESTPVSRPREHRCRQQMKIRGSSFACVTAEEFPRSDCLVHAVPIY